MKWGKKKTQHPMIPMVVFLLSISIQLDTSYGKLLRQRRRSSTRMTDHDRRRSFRGSNSSTCRDVRHMFGLETGDNLITMRCTDLGDSHYRFACSYAKVRYKCPRSCRAPCEDSYSSDDNNRHRSENDNRNNNDDNDDVIHRINDDDNDDDEFSHERGNDDDDDNNDDDLDQERGNDDDGNIFNGDDHRSDRERSRESHIFDHDDDAFRGIN